MSFLEQGLDGMGLYLVPTDEPNTFAVKGKKLEAAIEKSLEAVVEADRFIKKVKRR